jgi:hypothetical protein
LQLLTIVLTTLLSPRFVLPAIYDRRTRGGAPAPITKSIPALMERRYKNQSAVRARGYSHPIQRFNPA